MFRNREVGNVVKVYGRARMYDRMAAGVGVGDALILLALLEGLLLAAAAYHSVCVPFSRLTVCCRPKGLLKIYYRDYTHEAPGGLSWRLEIREILEGEREPTHSCTPPHQKSGP